MKQNQLMAAAALAAAMFVSNSAMAQAQQADQADRPADSSSQTEQRDSSARPAGARAEQSDSSARPAGAREGQSADSKMSKDQKFARYAKMMNQFEIQAGQLAERQGEDENVKKLAAMIAKDHQQAQQKLQQASAKLKQGHAGHEGQASGQQQLGPVHQAILQELQKKQGMEFDRAFLYCNIGGHTEAVLMFRDAAKECQDEQLKQYAQQTLPSLQQHLEQAKQIAQYDEAQSAGATERGSGSQSGASQPRSSGSTPPDRSGTDTTNRRGAGTNDTGGGASSDSGSSGRSPAR